MTPARQLRAAVVAADARRVQRTTLTPPLTPTFDRFEPGTTLTRLTNSEHPSRTLRPGPAVVSFPDAFAGDEYDRLTALLGFSDPVYAGRCPLLQGLPFAGLLPRPGGSREWIVCSSTRSTMLARPGFTFATCSRVDVVTSSRFTRWDDAFVTHLCVSGPTCLWRDRRADQFSSADPAILQAICP